MKHLAAIALRITFSTYIVYSSQTATFAKIGRSKSHPEWVYPVFIPGHVPSKKPSIENGEGICLPNRCAGLGTREDQGFTSKPWSQLVAFQVGGVFPMRFASSQGDPSFPPGVGFLLCVSTAAGDGGVWVGTNDLCRLCCGSSSFCCADRCGSFSALKLHACFFTKRSGCIVLTTRKHWGFG